MENSSMMNKLSRRLIASDIKEVISRIPFLNYSINSFLFGITEENEKNKKMSLAFEIKEKISFLELGIIHSEISSRIIREMEHIDHYFIEIVQKLTNSKEPQIGFFSFGEGPFKGITIYKQGQYYCKV